MKKRASLTLCCSSLMVWMPSSAALRALGPAFFPTVAFAGVTNSHPFGAAAGHIEPVGRQAHGRGAARQANPAGLGARQAWQTDPADPKAGLEGSMLPAGRVKGAMLALVVELLVTEINPGSAKHFWSSIPASWSAKRSTASGSRPCRTPSRRTEMRGYRAIAATILPKKRPARASKFLMT